VKKEKWGGALYSDRGWFVVGLPSSSRSSRSVLIGAFVLNIYGQTARLAQANLTIMIMMLLPADDHAVLHAFLREGCATTCATLYGRAAGWTIPCILPVPMGSPVSWYFSNYYLRKDLWRGTVVHDRCVAVLGVAPHCRYHALGGDLYDSRTLCSGLLCHWCISLSHAPRRPDPPGIDREGDRPHAGPVGPPLLQPFYDVGKLFEKENAVVTATPELLCPDYVVFHWSWREPSSSQVGTCCSSYSPSPCPISSSYLERTPRTPPNSHVGAERELSRSLLTNPDDYPDRCRDVHGHEKLFCKVPSWPLPVPDHPLPARDLIGYLIVLTIKAPQVTVRPLNLAPRTSGNRQGV